MLFCNLLKNTPPAKLLSDKRGQGSLVAIILASIIGTIVIGSATQWYLSMNQNMNGTNDRLEAMTIAMSEWQRLEHMSLDELEDNRENYKTPYNVGDKFKVGVNLGEQGFFDEGKCNSLTGTYAGESANCFKDTIMTVYDADGYALYTTRSLPLSAGSGADNFPEGTILPYTGDLAKIPKGWVLCDGTNGTPDLTGRFLEGTKTTTGEFREAGLPNINGYAHVLTVASYAIQGGSLFYSGRSYEQISGSVNNVSTRTLNIDASRSSAVYGKSDTVQPLSFTVFYIMKTNTDFHYDHTNGFVSPDYYTKDEVDSLLVDKENLYNNTFLPMNSKKYVHNTTEDLTLSMGYNDNTHIVQMYVDSVEKTALPRGTILPYAGKIADIPTGWYVCDGTNGTPKLFGRVLQSYDESHNVGDFVEASIPNLKGQISFGYADSSGGRAGMAFGANGNFIIPKGYGTRPYPLCSGVIEYAPHYADFNASFASSVYKDDATTVQPLAYIVCYIIKME